MTADRPTVVRVLREVALLLELKGENAFKVRAYLTAADRLAGLSDDLAQVVAEGRLRDIPGVGAALADKIRVLVTTGSLPLHQALLDELPPGILELVQVPDLGPKKALALWQALGVGDLPALEAACRAGRVRAVRGFGARTEEKILAGIERYRRSAAASPRRRLASVLPIAEALLEQVRAAPGVTRAAVAGSVRRFCETVGDVDLVAAAPAAGPVFDAFAALPLVAEVIGRGESKCSVRLLREDLQVDLRVLPEADFATALHHFTGSKAHHVRLRGLAQDRGLKISEWGLFRGEEKLRVAEEADLYRWLGLPDIPPELREDAGEIEAALAGALPADLVTEADVLGNVHSHSTWSDGRNSLREMAEAARALGFRYLTVTDHSRTASYAGGLSVDDLQRQWDEIDEINATTPGMRLLKGVESDILADGTLDYPARILDRLDVVIGSIHQRHQLDEAQMTRRVLTAFANPWMHIWGHPTGRLIQKREPAPMRMAELLDAAAAHGVAVEVNGSPDRLDLSAEHVRMAVERGVKLVVSTDAHSIADLHNLRWAVRTARRGWARRSDVLNTLPVEGFLAALRTAPPVEAHGDSLPRATG